MPGFALVPCLLCLAALDPKSTPDGRAGESPVHLRGQDGSATGSKERASDGQDSGPKVPPKPTLNAEDQGTLELLRSVIAEKDLDGARELLHEVVTGLEPPAPGAEEARIAFLTRLDEEAVRLGSLPESMVLCAAILELRTRILPPDHSDLLDAKENLAVTRHELGDLVGARDLFEAVLQARARLLSTDHPELLRAKQNMAATRAALGDLAGARELEEAVLQARMRLLPPDHPDLLIAMGNLAVTRKALGELDGALELFEALLQARVRLLPRDHPDLLSTKQNLAATRLALGDPAGARALLEEVLEARTRLLPPDHPFLLSAKQNLAVARAELDDLPGARELQEELLEVRTRLLPPDHPDLLKTKGNLALLRKLQGDLAGARELEEAVLQAWTLLLPPDHPDLLHIKEGLGVTRYAQGDFAGARELLEAVLEARTSTVSPDHPELLGTKHNLALTRHELRDLAGARDLLEAVLEARTRTLPSDHPRILKAKLSLARMRQEQGDLAGARELVSSLLAGMCHRARALGAEAPRAAREGARAELHRLAEALSLCSADPESRLAPELFATLESLRLASIASSEAALTLAAHPQLADEARAIAALRSKLNDLTAAGPEAPEAAEDWSKAVVELAEERDRAERGLHGRLGEAGALVEVVSATGIAARLESGAAAVSFLRYSKHFERDAETQESPPSVEALLAMIVKADGAVRRVELGAAADLEHLVLEWRRALGAPIERSVAVEVAAGEVPARSRKDISVVAPLAPGPERPCVELGHALAGRVLAPVIAAAGEGLRSLHVVLDDFLHLVPFDALPMEDGTLVGERLEIHVVPTFERLLREREPVPQGGSLLALGGIDFGAELVTTGGGEAPDSGPTSLIPRAATPPIERTGLRFEPLNQTRHEIEAVAARYREARGGEALLLSGSSATKAALLTAAPKARFLHIATHGWFVNERFLSQLDALTEPGTRDALMRADETLIGFAPETLCGLALAGANRGKDELGRVPGILTAEELASIDLRNCELAVLSACETNVGIRRAGQGMQSLQSALHAAGARTAITSLWKVDDDATRRLFEHFYTQLWKEELGKADALWKAKMALRAEGHPPRDWAGWVLSGDPN